jgi:uncharacterized protein
MSAFIRGLLVASYCMLSTVAAQADFQDKQPISLTTSGATATGFGRAVVEALNAIVRDAYPGSTMTFRPNTLSGGLVDIVNGDAQLAIGPTNVEIPMALEGQAPFDQPMKGKLTYMFAALPGTEFFFVGMKPWADAAGVKTFQDFVTKKPRTTVSLGSRGSIYIGAVAESLLKAGGSSIEQVEKRWPGTKAVYLTSNRALDDMKDGKVDFAVGTAFQPFESINEVARDRSLLWVDMPDSFLQAAAKDYDLEIINYPKGFYPFIDRDVKTLRINLFLLASTNTSEEAVYKYMKAVGSNFDRFRAIHPAYKNLTMQELAKKPPTLEYHPGAARYFREVGILK